VSCGNNRETGYLQWSCGNNREMNSGVGIFLSFKRRKNRTIMEIPCHLRFVRRGIKFCVYYLLYFLEALPKL
jgi:hypothetical protein